ncbi:MAG: NADH-quinone oxidoreductase subunit NuoN [Alphaproteobacteria bacterium]|nr:NADH-quinone oxidoreductase subunit NuoN [Alphaproteobacteria bacterium]
MTDVEALLFSLSWSQPELWLAGFALVATLVGAAFGDRASGPLSIGAALVMVIAATLAALHRPETPVVIFNGSLVVDGFSAAVKTIVGYSAAATLLLASEHLQRSGDRRFEFPVLVTLAVLGMFVMASAHDLIALYIGVELQSLAAYVMAAFRRDDARSSEAGLKYFVLGALSSGLLLYGASLIYGFAGSVKFAEIATQIGDGNAGLTFGLVFLLCGLAFKMSAAPFHMWTPDVYEGAPTPVTAFFAAAPKMAAVALMARVIYGPFGALEAQWVQVIAALAAISLVVGSVAALVQTNIKRLMAYSSIANMGFVLMALAAGAKEGAPAALLYMALYLPATIGIFAVIQAMWRDGKPVEDVADLAGLARRTPWMAYILTALLFSLTGIPPLAGFFGKYAAFLATVNAGLVWLAILAGLATVVGAGYYLRVVKVIWFDAPAPAFDRTGGAVVLTAGVSAALTVLVLVVGAGAVQSWIAISAATSFAAPPLP